MISLRHFLAMGGYSFYVWSAYGITFAILSYYAFASIRNYKRLQRRLKKLLAQQPQ